MMPEMVLLFHVGCANVCCSRWRADSDGLRHSSAVKMVHYEYLQGEYKFALQKEIRYVSLQGRS